jgi:hypothetical protein
MDHTGRVQVITGNATIPRYLKLPGKGKKGKPMSEANAKKEEDEFWRNWVESHPSTTEETPIKYLSPIYPLISDQPLL